MRRSHIVAAGVFALGATLMPSAASAEPPQELTSRFTDLADLASNDSAIESELNKIPGKDFWIVTVNNTDGIDAQKWAQETHRRSGMDSYDGVIVISSGTSEVGWHSTAPDPGVSEITINKAANDDVMKLFSAQKWDEGILALAKNVDSLARGGDAVVGGPAQIPWVAVGGGALALGGGALAMGAARKRRSAKASLEEADKQVQIASAALLATDDDVRAASAELEFARAEFGLEATKSFQQTLEKAKAATQSAFQLHSQLHDTDPETPQQKVELSEKITELVGTARQALDLHTKEFSELRKLAANVDSKISEIRTRMSEIAGRLDLGRRTLDNLEVNYPASALQTLRTYPDQVAHLLEASEESLKAAGNELASDDRNGAVPYVRMAEGTLNQASQLAETLLNAPKELEAEQEEVRRRIESLSSDIADAKRLAPADPAVAPLMATAQETVQRASAGQVDPFRMAEELHDTESKIDLALEPFRQADEARKKLQADAAHALLIAKRALDEADSTVTRYRASTRSGAREQLAQAHDLYLRATQAGSPQEQIQLAEAARLAAGRAKQAAFNDIERMDRGGPYGSGGYSSRDDSFAGAMAGSILGGIARGIIIGGLSGGFGGGGGGGGGFGGSGSIGGGGATGGRRGF